MGWVDNVKETLKHRLNPKTIAAEIVSVATDKVIPQGADEIGNVLMSGSAYLPWPGKGEDHTVPAPEAQPEIQPVQSEPVISNGETARLNGYMTGYQRETGYTPEIQMTQRETVVKNEPNLGDPGGSLHGYMTGYKDYNQRLNEAASHGLPDHTKDRGIER